MLASRVLGSVARLPPGFVRSLLDNMRFYGAVDGFLGTFRVSFTHWLEKTEQVLASAFGPFPWPEKVVCAAFVAGVVALVLRDRRRGTAKATPPAVAVRGVRPAMAALGALAVLAPAAMQVPDDLSLIDFRLITTATILGIAAIPPHLFVVPRRARFALGALTAAFLAIWTKQLSGTAGEVMETVRLVDRLQPTNRLLALPMHDASAYLDGRNAVLHYAAVHHTARHAGITSLFWGRFSPRLPVGYRQGQEPPHPFDWAPWELEDEQLLGFSHVLVRWPERADEARLHDLARHVNDLRDSGVLKTMACDGRSCLFEIVGPKVTARGR